MTRKKGFYEKYIKRILDIICSLFALIVFSWLYVIIAIAVRIKLGSPVIFKQPRPGLIDPKTGRERIFDLYKFRTMSEERNKDGELLPDEERLGHFGKMLRATSLDELPEAINILKGEMSVIGPRPQLVRDMVFMSDKQRMRHTAKPGLSGLAQIKGRNAITWEEKINWDLRYLKEVSLWNDLKLVFHTVRVAIVKQEGITDGENVTALDYGDALLKEGTISEAQYHDLQIYAKKIIDEYERGKKR